MKPESSPEKQTRHPHHRLHAMHMPHWGGWIQEHSMTLAIVFAALAVLLIMRLMGVL